MDTTQLRGQATRITLRDFTSPQMRAFHMTWGAFFLAFYGWFGIAPLMSVVRDDLGLSKTQVGNIVIASVAVTIVARLIVGRLLDYLGPRRTYAGLLVVSAIPIMGIGLAQSYETFLLMRLAIGVAGASFVITQYHTSLMFAPNVVGTANATTAGWGNLGGGVTQMVMPLLFAGLVALGATEALGWRLAMIAPGIALLVAGVAYYVLTRDAPEGDLRDLRARNQITRSDRDGSFWEAARDHRVLVLAVIYGACFGIELALYNVAALYFHDRFELGVATAGLIAGLFGLMNLFARTLGGVLGDRAGVRFGLRGRVWLLGILILCEGITLIAFSRSGALALAIPVMMIFSLFVQMSNGATFSIVPFINRRSLGSVSGIVGAGGNAGAVAAGFLFRIETLATQDAFLIMGITVVAISSLALLVRFSPETEAEERRWLESALSERDATSPVPAARAGAFAQSAE